MTERRDALAHLTSFAQKTKDSRESVSHREYYESQLYPIFCFFFLFRFPIHYILSCYDPFKCLGPKICQKCAFLLAKNTHFHPVESYRDRKKEQKTHNNKTTRKFNFLKMHFCTFRIQI